MDNAELVVGSLKLVDHVVYVGPHLLAESGWQFAFDFGETVATLCWTPETHGVELMAYGARPLQLEDLDIPGALEVLKGLVK